MFNSTADFDKFYSLYFDSVYTFSFALSQSITLSNDIVHQVFTKFLESEKELESEKSGFFELLKITDWAYFNFLSHKKKGYLYRKGMAKEDENNIKFDNKYFLINLINKTLSIRELKEVYILRFILGLSIDDISKILSYPKDAIKTNLVRARDLILQEWKNSTF